jgi:hypothetical protein
MSKLSKPWFEVQMYWGDEDDAGWVREDTFSTLEEAQAYVNESDNPEPYRIVQCFVVSKGE